MEQIATNNFEAGLLFQRRVKGADHVAIFRLGAAAIVANASAIHGERTLMNLSLIHI